MKKSKDHHKKKCIKKVEQQSSALEKYETKLFTRGGVLNQEMKMQTTKDQGELYMQQNKYNTQQPEAQKNDKKMLNDFFDVLKNKRIQEENKQLEKKEQPQRKQQFQSSYQIQNSYDQVQAIFQSINRRKSHYFTNGQGNWIYILGLSLRTNEQQLQKQFENVGQINQIEIQIKQNDNLSSRLIGYVKFQTHEMAQQAIQKFNNKYIQDQIVQIYFGSPYENQIMLNNHEITQISKIFVPIPKQNLQKVIIDKLSKLVSQDGNLIEEALIRLEKNNAEYSFLQNRNSDEFIYYKWRTYSFCMGDSEGNYRLQPFQMTLNGTIWYPPQNLDEENEIKYENKKKQLPGIKHLPEKDQQELEDIIMNLTQKRSSIANAMMWALERSDYSANISYILFDSLITEYASLQLKVNRLYLLNDILHNSNLPSSVLQIWSYRIYIEHKLPEIFESLNYYLQLEQDQIIIDKFKQNIYKILKVWNDSLIFDQNFILGLQSTFNRQNNRIIKINEKQFQFNCSDQIREQLNNTAKNLQEMNLFQIEANCFKNGLSIQGNKSDMIERLLFLQEYQLNIQSQNNEEQNNQILKQRGMTLLNSYNSFSIKNTMDIQHQILEMKELLQIIQQRQANINENDLQGQSMDDFDQFLIESLQGVEIQSNSNNDEDIDGESMTQSEIEYAIEKSQKENKQEQIETLKQMPITDQQKLDKEIQDFRNILINNEIYCTQEIDAICIYKKQQLIQEKYKSLIQKKRIILAKDSSSSSQSSKSYSSSSSSSSRSRSRRRYKRR